MTPQTPEPQRSQRTDPTIPPPRTPTASAAPTAPAMPGNLAVPTAPHGPEPPGGPPTEPTALARLDALVSRPFPERRARTTVGESGPGFHVAPLWASGPLWDADPADAAAAREECTDQLAALVAMVSLRWGEPVVHDLTDALDRSARGLPVPAPLDLLCTLVPRVYAWRGGGRWIAVGAGPLEPRQPRQVLGAVAAGPPREGEIPGGDDALAP
ncbi:hypothetical protein ACIQU6_09500 [Streptomyces sp. NPDC090442]|uniref:hypothetical protein n=1 Tax=Streptomyces sp. NPDC090442 TaxID=3365962 RepID=UPI0038049306